MKIEAGQEIGMMGGMLGSALWTAITSDTFIPSLLGAAMAVTFRALNAREDEATNPTLVDYTAVFIMSLVVGIIVGPWLADQLPDGQGVIGVASLFTSFVGVRFLQKLHQMEWDVGATLQAIAKSFTTKK